MYDDFMYVNNNFLFMQTAGMGGGRSRKELISPGEYGRHTSLSDLPHNIFFLPLKRFNLESSAFHRIFHNIFPQKASRASFFRGDFHNFESWIFSS